ncbi:MAG: VWA domain-containing protein [Thermoanaerobaculia bacterium]|nr:VWA domain-containing protein [Thermoanaerobaculia bacterium]
MVATRSFLRSSCTHRAVRSLAFLAVVAIGTCLTFDASLAQDGDTPTPEIHSLDLSEAIEVVEIQLEVLVTDRRGRVVDGLSSEDFDVRIGGGEAEVLAVDRVGGPTADSPRRSSRRTVSRSARSGDGGLALAVFVDQLHISPASSWRVLSQVVEFLKDELRTGDRVMVATYDGSTKVKLPFTDDLRHVKESLVEIGQIQSRRLAVDEEVRTMQQIQELQEMNFQGNRGQPCVNLEPVAIGYATAAHRQTLAAISSLEYFVDSLAGLPGRKAVLHVSDGLPLIPGRGPYEYIIELCGGLEGAARGVENRFDYGTDVYDHTDINKMRLDMMRYDTTEQWYQLAARANRNNVTFYPLQASGLRDSSFGGVTTQTRGASSVVDLGRGLNQQDSLVLLATETGGRAILHQNRVGDALGRMSGELRDYYLLSVRGQGGRAGDVRKVSVEVDRPGVEVRHRRSLRIQSRHQQVADRVLTTTLHVATDNSMGLSAEFAGQEQTSGDRRSVRLKLQIPLSSLTLLPAAPDQPSQGRFTVFLAAADLEGRTTPVRTSTVPVTVRPGDETLETYTFEVEMEMRDGQHVVGFGVLDEIGGETSYLRQVVGG